MDTRTFVLFAEDQKLFLEPGVLHEVSAHHLAYVGARDRQAAGDVGEFVHEFFVLGLELLQAQRG
jgi:hypothetical protein